MFFSHKLNNIPVLTVLIMVSSAFIGLGLFYGIFDFFLIKINQGKIDHAFFGLSLLTAMSGFLVFFILYNIVQFKNKHLNNTFKSILLSYGFVSFLSSMIWGFYIVGKITYDAFDKDYGFAGILVSSGFSILGFIGFIYLAIFMVKKFLAMDETITQIERMRIP